MRKKTFCNLGGYEKLFITRKIYNPRIQLLAAFDHQSVVGTDEQIQTEKFS